ncbi:MAG: enoyl-CoA hydratase/isomerase family protein [Lautropia sp.]|nr:enoyl-CoA hydratase/isomerase family protein [Lautropia sp.]
MTQAPYTTQDGIAIITLANPPVNGLGHELRTGIVQGVRRAEADPAVSAVVITGAGSAFSGGADIREFNTPKALAEPNLGTVIRTVEGAAKPVIAAIHSVCMGGGLELALGCHYRVALSGAQIALPEVKLGLVPGAGGTQRLPRVVPLEMAVNIIVSGNPVPSEKFKGTQLFDALFDADLTGNAVAFARQVVAGNRGRPRVRDRSIESPDAEAFLRFARNMAQSVARHLPAPVKCIDAITAAVKLPFEEGLKEERRLFVELLQTPESRALRHAFFGERAASKIPDVSPDTPVREIKAAAVIGAGTMGGGIAMNFVNAGIPVTILETSREALDKGLATIRKNYENSARKGRLKPEDVEKRMGMLKPTLSYADLKDADIVIEAVFEDMAVKEKVFGQLDAVMKPGAILASNTSTLNLDQIAAFTQRPQDVIGTHFFSPANVMKLLEIVRGRETAKDVLATTMKLSKKIRKTGVVSGVCDGFIGNRMIEQYFRQAGYLVEVGASPQKVDRAVEKWGFAMGPFRMGDLAGNDVGWYIRKRRYVERPDMKYPRLLDKVCELGRFGQKTGAGMYRYDPGKRDALPDPVIDDLITRHRQEIGVAPRRISDDEIVHRLLLALVNEGAKILEEGIAMRASDIDMIYLTGYGFPLHRGGPMLYADMMGLYGVVDRMKQFAANPHGDPAFWTPAPLLAKLAAEGKSFNG